MLSNRGIIQRSVVPFAPTLCGTCGKRTSDPVARACTFANCGMPARELEETAA